MITDLIDKSANPFIPSSAGIGSNFSLAILSVPAGLMSIFSFGGRWLEFANPSAGIWNGYAPEKLSDLRTKMHVGRLLCDTDMKKNQMRFEKTFSC